MTLSDRQIIEVGFSVMGLGAGLLFYGLWSDRGWLAWVGTAILVGGMVTMETGFCLTAWGVA